MLQHTASAECGMDDEALPPLEALSFHESACASSVVMPQSRLPRAHHAHAGLSGDWPASHAILNASRVNAESMMRSMVEMDASEPSLAAAGDANSAALENRLSAAADLDISHRSGTPSSHVELSIDRSVTTIMPFFGSEHEKIVEDLVSISSREAAVERHQTNTTQVANGSSTSPLVSKVADLFGSLWQVLAGNEPQRPLCSPWRRLPFSTRYAHYTVEMEFLVHFHQHRSQIFITTGYGVVAIITETSRLAPAVRDSPLLSILVVAGAMGFIFLFFGTLKLTRDLQRHLAETTNDAENDRRSTSAVSKSLAIRNNARYQELLILALVVLFGVFMVLSTASLRHCPWVDTLAAKVLYCQQAFGSDSFFLLLYATPAVLLPLRFTTALIGSIFNTVCLVVAVIVVLMKGPPQTSNHHTHNADLVLIDNGLVISKMWFYISFSTLMLYVTHTNEKRVRIEFEQVTLLGVFKEEATRLHQVLARQLTATIPGTVARKLLDGVTVRDMVRDAGVLVFGIPSFSLWAATQSSAEVVELLNRIFCCIDTKVQENAQLVAKMQTVGDTYLVISGSNAAQPDATVSAADPNIVGGVTPQADATNHRRHNAVVIAAFAEQVAGALSEVTTKKYVILLDVCDVICTVFGLTSTYIALGADSVVQQMRAQPFEASGIRVTKKVYALLVAPGKAVVEEEGAITGAVVNPIDPIAAPTSNNTSNESLAARDHVKSFSKSFESSNSDIDGGVIQLNNLQEQTSFQLPLLPVVTQCLGNASKDGEDTGGEQVRFEIERVKRDVATTRSFLVLHTFKNKAVEKQYEELRAASVLDRKENISFVLAAHLSLLLLCLRYSQHVESRTVAHRNAFLTTAVASLVAAVVGPFVRGHLRRAAYIAWLGMIQVALWTAPHPSSATNNTVLWSLAITLVSTQRQMFMHPLLHVLMDTVTINLPLWALFVFHVDRLRVENSTTMKDFIRDYPHVITRMNPESVIGPLTHSDMVSMYVQAFYLNVLVVVSVNLVVRTLHERFLRESFANSYVLQAVTKRMRCERTQMETYVRSIIPRFMVDRFEKYCRSVDASNDMDAAVDPWFGAWFASGVKDLSVMVIQVGLYSDSASRAPLATKGPTTHDAPQQQPSTGTFFSSHRSSGASTTHQRSSAFTSPILVHRIPSNSTRRPVDELFDVVCDAHAVVDSVLKTFGGYISKAKSAGDVLILIGSEADEDGLRAEKLLRCAAAIGKAFESRPYAPKIVLNSGLGVGAVIGSDRLTFELFGEVVSTSMELLNAMPTRGIIATQRFVNQVKVRTAHGISFVDDSDAAPQELVAFAMPSVLVRKQLPWRVRGSTLTSVHSVQLQE